MVKKLLIVCGGRSAEHEISIKSAKNILKAIDRTQYMPILIGISRSGTWYYLENESYLEHHSCIEDTLDTNLIASLVPFPQITCLSTQQGITIPIDIAFPVLHGPFGEDGTIQGLFDMVSLPYVGGGVLASSTGMDKDIFKKILSYNNIPIVPFLTIDKADTIPSYYNLVEKFRTDTLFIKPVWMGSSIGISKVKNDHELVPAINLAFNFSHKVIIEPGIDCREIECAVLGNLTPKASVLGEIRPTHEFYSYEAKYNDPKGADLIIPADLDIATTKEIQDLAIKTFKAIDCRGLARVDFFVDQNRKIYVNEINTLPGFTNISMYPKLWQTIGTSYSELISQLLALAIEEFETRKQVSLTHSA